MGKEGKKNKEPNLTQPENCRGRFETHVSPAADLRTFTLALPLRSHLYDPFEEL